MYKNILNIMEKTNSNNTIPKIIHQIWIGTKPSPSKFMGSWKTKNPDFEYIFWNEKEFEKRGIVFESQYKIDSIEEINGKADIIRWELLWMFGGVFLDADSICIEPIDDVLMKCSAFSGYENEQVREGLVATGTMGFPPKHPLCREAVDWVKTNPVSQRETGQRAWYNVGPGLLTRLLQTNKYPEFKVFPSHYFLPFHYTGIKYSGHEKVYAYQEWGSTKQNYDVMNDIELPDELKAPKEWVSILIPSYNTKTRYIKECLDSIKSQVGNFGMEIVWINDGSDDLNSKLLESMLKRFKIATRFVKIIYEKTPNNGVCKSLNYGLSLCNNEIVFRMDSDDIMFPNRIQKQLEFMSLNVDAQCCGTNIQFFNNEHVLGQQTTHPTKITWEIYKKEKSQWFMNHPTLCFKKSAVLNVGNYNIETNSAFEDLELELLLLKKYGVLYNLPDILLYYRIHNDQVTFNGRTSTPYWRERREKFIEDITKEETVVEPVLVEPVEETVVEETVVEETVHETVEPVDETVVEQLEEPVAETLTETLTETVEEPLVEQLEEPLEETVQEETVQQETVAETDEVISRRVVEDIIKMLIVSSLADN